MFAQRHIKDGFIIIFFLGKGLSYVNEVSIVMALLSKKLVADLKFTSTTNYNSCTPLNLNSDCYGLASGYWRSSSDAFDLNNPRCAPTLGAHDVINTL